MRGFRALHQISGSRDMSAITAFQSRRGIAVRHRSHYHEKNDSQSHTDECRNFCVQRIASEPRKRRSERIVHSRARIGCVVRALLRRWQSGPDGGEAWADTCSSPYVLCVGCCLDRQRHQGRPGGRTHPSRQLGTPPHRLRQDYRREPRCNDQRACEQFQSTRQEVVPRLRRRDERRRGVERQQRPTIRFRLSTHSRTLRCRGR